MNEKQLLHQVALVIIICFSGLCAALAAGGFYTQSFLVAVPTVGYAWFWFRYPIVEPQDGLFRVLRMMRRYPESEQIQKECCEALFRLASAKTKQQRCKLRMKKGDRERLVSENGIQQVIAALETHEENGEIVGRALAALGKLVQIDAPGHEEKRNVLTTDNELLDFTLSVISRNIALETVAKYGMEYLTWAAQDSVANWPPQRCAMLLNLIFSSLSFHEDKAIIESWAICLLFELSQTNIPEAVSFMTDKEQMETLISLLERHVGEQSVQSSGLGLCSIALSRVIEHTILDGSDFNGAKKNYELVNMILKSGLFALVEVAEVAFPGDTVIEKILHSLRNQRKVLESAHQNYTLRLQNKSNSPTELEHIEEEVGVSSENEDKAIITKAPEDSSHDLNPEMEVEKHDRPSPNETPDPVPHNYQENSDESEQDTTPTSGKTSHDVENLDRKLGMRQRRSIATRSV